MTKYVLASDEVNDLICDTGSLSYMPDPVKHKYGESTRPPLEDLLIPVMNFIKDKYPDHEIFTLGESCIFGERFVTHLTVCEFDLLPGSIDNLKIAVKESDMAIRNKLGSMWNWFMCVASSKDKEHAAVTIGWFDFAYFSQHRRDFLDVDHNRFMASFASSTPTAIDYKIMHDGEIVEFDSENLDESDREVFNKHSEVTFNLVDRNNPEKIEPLRMV